MYFDIGSLISLLISDCRVTTTFFIVSEDYQIVAAYLLSRVLAVSLPADIL